MTNKIANSTLGLVDIFLSKFITEDGKEKDTMTDEMKWTMVGVSAMCVLHELVPFWERIPTARRNRLLAEYEKVVSDYTLEQVAVYLNHSLPDMKKKLIFHVAVAKHAIAKILKE